MVAGSPGPTAPRTIGRYLLHGEIAAGGMATVHFGQIVGPVGFSRPVAIKRLHAQFAKDPEFVTMFLDEARLAARVFHPNVVATLDVVALDAELFVVMEYIRGVPLSRLVHVSKAAGARIPLRMVVSILCGALHGLHAAHEAKNEKGDPLEIVHRDVSPQNILVGVDGVARVIDFGVAKAAGRLQTTRDGQLKGKLAYMAPEQVRGAAVTRRTDVYAAGVVLWEMLTGARLFKADNEARVLARVLEGNVERPSARVHDLPKAFDDVVMRAIDPDPAQRFATAREMAVELARCADQATAPEVGDWMETAAAVELEQRAARIAEIERSSSTASAQPNEEPTVVSQVSSVAAVQQPAAPTQRRPLTARRALMAGAVALVGGLLLVLAARTMQPRTAGRPPDVTASSSAHTAVAPTPSETPGQGMAVTVNPPSSGPTSAPSAAPSPPAAARSASPPAKPAKRDPPVTRAAAQPDCNPPYTTDERGHTHFKPACL